jgi:hypothetical protein
LELSTEKGAYRKLISSENGTAHFLVGSIRGRGTNPIEFIPNAFGKP